MKKLKISKTRLRALIEEAIVDAYTEDEQEGGFLVMLEENMPTPFPARVVGEEVEVVGFDQGVEDRGIMAICQRQGKKHRASVTSLEWSGKPPKGAEWIAAYQAWVRGNW